MNSAGDLDALIDSFAVFAAVSLATSGIILLLWKKWIKRSAGQDSERRRRSAVTGTVDHIAARIRVSRVAAIDGDSPELTLTRRHRDRNWVDRFGNVWRWDDSVGWRFQLCDGRWPHDGLWTAPEHFAPYSDVASFD